MKLLLLLIITTYLSTTSAKSCKEELADRCATTDYKSYVECVRRTKRSTDCESSCNDIGCDDNCNDCDCNSCASSCEDNSCESCCNTCCKTYSGCKTNHCCHKTCHATCKSSSCRSSCRKSCYDNVRKEKVVETERQLITNSNVKPDNHNITTIIHLNNVINNTNLIDVPITLNNTNINNISISAPESYGYDSGYNREVIREIYNKEREIVNKETKDENNCCTVISPRQCAPQDQFPFVKCFHYRSKQCGAQCNAPIVHVEPQNICDPTPQGPSCNQQLVYIPQPQTRCSYKSTWPYVSCNVQGIQDQSCSGCYSHYVDKTSKTYQNCEPGCYDDGYANGPLFRQGPFYRPGYSITPPCYQLGNCGYNYPYPYNGEPNAAYAQLFNNPLITDPAIRNAVNSGIGPSLQINESLIDPSWNRRFARGPNVREIAIETEVKPAKEHVISIVTKSPDDVEKKSENSTSVQ